ncbi:MAG: Dabb family protein [Desulfovibrio sp.]|jgi:hypothetical protein|nr:Dabb family protein [Desulfovibrio sp.]
MIRHIVWWTLKPEAEGCGAEENARQIVERSAAMQGLSCLDSLEVSRNVLQSSTVPAQVVLTSTHNTQEDFLAYRDHPVHREFAAFLGKRAEKRYCIDFALEDPKN